MCTLSTAITYCLLLAFLLPLSILFVACRTVQLASYWKNVKLITLHLRFNFSTGSQSNKEVSWYDKHSLLYMCNGAEWSKDKTQAAESIKWRPQQAYCSNQFLLVQPQTVFSTHTKSSRSRIYKRTARATGNTRYRYSKILYDNVLIDTELL